MRMIGWSILVEPRRVQTSTNSGLMLAPMSRLPPSTGRVMCISRAAAEEYPEIKLGAELHFKPFGGHEFRWDGIEYRVLRREDALAIVERSAV